MQHDQHDGAGPGGGLWAVPGARRGASAVQGLGQRLVHGVGEAARLGAGPRAVRGAVLRQGPRAGLGLFRDDTRMN